MRLHAPWLVALLFACHGGDPDSEPSRSRDARVDTHESLLADRDAQRHPADGGGRARLVSAPSPPVPVGSRHRFEILYEAGPLGIEPGGAVVLQPSPFWGWDAPQVGAPEAPGYTTASTGAPGVELAVELAGPSTLVIRVEGRRLVEGEAIRIVYGAGSSGARVDRFAERGARIHIGVDGDGDGVRSLLEEEPSIDVAAGRPSRLVFIGPSTARPGERVRFTLAVLDALGNAGAVPDFDAPVAFESIGAGLELPESLSEPGTFEALATSEGVYRPRAAVVLSDGTRLTAESNPLVVRRGIPRVLWADLHGHSQVSDGTGTPEDYFRYARDVARLDVVALTDHDHWGMSFLDDDPETWRRIRETARSFDEPGRFVALSGYEWTSWIHGHRHVLHFDDGGELLSSLDPDYDTPRKLWNALELRGDGVLTVAHHSAGGPVSVNWEFVPPEELEPVTEVVSVHGSSEAADTPGRIYDAVEGNYVRDVLDRGLRFGFVGSGDSHDGHPGLAHLAAPSGGLAALFAEEPTREAVLDTLRARRTYATNGSRIWLRVWLDEDEMGSVISESPADEQELRFTVAGTSPIDRVDVVRSGSVVVSLGGNGERERSARLPLGALAAGEYVYVRVVQRDGGAGWSSPIYVGSR